MNEATSKTLERELEKCLWLVKEERLKLGVNELSERHQSNIRRLVDELRINCKEYARLNGRGSVERRKAAVRYSRLFQKAIDDYVVSTQLSQPTVDYLKSLERLEENIIEVLRFKQRRKFAVANADALPCPCFNQDLKKNEILSLVEEVAERQSLKKSASSQTEFVQTEFATQTQFETKEQSTQANCSSRSVGIGDNILIPEISTRSSMSSSNDGSLGELLQQFRRVLRDETPKSARIRFDEVHRVIDESCIAASDLEDLSERSTKKS